ICGRRIIRRHDTPFTEKLVHNVQRRRFADVICPAFERQAQHANSLSAERPECRADLLKEANLLLLIDLFYLVQHSKFHTDKFGNMTKCRNVLGETRSTVTYACT